MKTVTSAVALIALLAVGTAVAEFDAIIKDCNDCHGDDGVSQWDDMPTIAGIDAFVHSEALYVYRDRARRCATTEYRQGDTSRAPTNMCDAVQNLSDEQIEAIAEHYAALPFVPAKQPFDAELAAQGQAIHDKVCARCHSDGGSNPEDEASILAGQWMGYMRTTFAEYASGEREQPIAMKRTMDPLTEEEVEALLHYYASQQ